MSTVLRKKVFKPQLYQGVLSKPTVIKDFRHILKHINQ